jgi:predicted nucleic acid-binding protein
MYSSITSRHIQSCICLVNNVSAAAAITQQVGLLSGDALVVAVMQEHGLVNLASHDADFDRVPGLRRYAPA